MVAIVIQDFGGRLPRRAPRLLPDNFSQICENVNLAYGDLRGYHDFKLLHEFPTASGYKRVWRVKNTAQTLQAWYGSTDPNAVLVKSPLVNDSFDRYYLFQQSQPPQVLTFAQIAAGDPSANLAFSQPVNAPSLSPTGGVDTNLVTRVYAYTFVTSWGEESRLSPVTSINVKKDVTSVTVTCNTGVPASPATIAGRTFTKVRIYRTVTSATGAQFYFLADATYVSNAAVAFVDDKSDLEIVINSPLIASQNDPVATGVWGTRVLANGALVAFKDRDIYFSVPFLPHAWPEDWRLTIADTIIGVEVMGQDVMVLTRGYPVLIYGSYPDAMGMLKFSFPEPCISYGSIVAAPEGVYFGSYSGLCLFTPDGVTNITSNIIDRNDWHTHYLSPDHDLGVDNTRAERQLSRYIAAKSDGTWYIIDGREARLSLSDLVGLETIGDLSADIFTGDILAISIDAVYSWDHHDEMEIEYRWKSKKFVLAKPKALGAMMLHIENRATEWSIDTSIVNPGYSFPSGMDKKTQMLVKVWADGRLIFDRLVSDHEQCRLPSETVATVWEVEVTGQCRVQKIAIAETGRELETL